MRGGKEEEKIGGPLFPRLSLNDIEKGGPKPPPRNKMALYDPLSLPSDVMFSASSRQGAVKERGAFLPFQSSPLQIHANRRQSSSSPTYAFSNTTSENSFEKSIQTSNNVTEAPSPTSIPFIRPLMQNDEAEFSALTFFHSGMSVDSSTNNQLVLNKENDFICATSSSLQVQTSVTKSLKRSSSADLDSQRHVKSRSGEVPWFPKTSQDQVPESSNSRLKRGEFGEICCGKAWGQVDVAMQENKVANDDSNRQLRGFGMSNVHVLHRNGDLLSTSIGGCLSRAVLTPNDVVGAIGPKHFWKARAEIIKQQKMFSKQVFELHRIIKVQNFLTCSPHLLQDESHFLAKSINETSFNKDISPKSISDPHRSHIKVRNEVPKTKFVDDERVENAPLVPSLNNDLTTNVTTNFWPNIERSTMFNPTKGLIYKPHVGICPLSSGGFPSIPYSGYGMTNTTSQCGDFVPNMPYGVLLCNPPMAMGPTYLSPYGMLVMGPSLSTSTIEQMVEKQASDDFSAPYRRSSSCCMATNDINASEGLVVKDGEKMGNSESFPKKMTSIDVLPLFPAGPTTPDIESQVKTCSSIEQKPQVIRVIPRKPHIS